VNGANVLNGDLDLARRIERAEGLNHVAFVRAMQSRGSGEGAAWLEIGGGIASFAGVGAHLTQAFGLGLNGPVEESDLDTLVRFYQSRSTAVAVEVCNLADTSLANGLVERGCRIDEHTHVLARSLDAPAVSRIPSEVRIVDDEILEEWCDVVTMGFTEGAVDPLLRDLLLVFFAQSNSDCYAAYRDGRIVGGGTVFFVDDLAILGGASTIMESRRRGVQNDLLAARLARAAERGSTLAIVSTSPGTTSQRNALRAGFSILYARTKFVSGE